MTPLLQQLATACGIPVEVSEARMKTLRAAFDYRPGRNREKQRKALDDFLRPRKTEIELPLIGEARAPALYVPRGCKTLEGQYEALAAWLDLLESMHLKQTGPGRVDVVIGWAQWAEARGFPVVFPSNVPGLALLPPVECAARYSWEREVMRTLRLVLDALPVLVFIRSDVSLHALGNLAERLTRYASLRTPNDSDGKLLTLLRDELSAIQKLIAGQEKIAQTIREKIDTGEIEPAYSKVLNGVDNRIGRAQAIEADLKRDLDDSGLAKFYEREHLGDGLTKVSPIKNRPRGSKAAGRADCVLPTLMEDLKRVSDEPAMRQHYGYPTGEPLPVELWAACAAELLDLISCPVNIETLQRRLRDFSES